MNLGLQVAAEYPRARPPYSIPVSKVMCKTVRVDGAATRKLCPFMPRSLWSRVIKIAQQATVSKIKSILVGRHQRHNLRHSLPLTGNPLERSGPDFEMENRMEKTDTVIAVFADHQTAESTIKSSSRQTSSRRNSASQASDTTSTKESPVSTTRAIGPNSGACGVRPGAVYPHPRQSRPRQAKGQRVSTLPGIHEHLRGRKFYGLASRPKRHQTWLISSRM